MKFTWEARREAIDARMTALEEQHKAAIETGDKTQAQAIIEQSRPLYDEALCEEQRLEETGYKWAWGKAVLFRLDIKGRRTQMKALNVQYGLA